MFGDLPSLDEHTLEYGLIEYRLQKLFNAPQLRLKDGQIFQSSNQEARFEQFASKLEYSNVIDAFVLAEEVSKRFDFQSKSLNIDHDNPFRISLHAKYINREVPTIEMVHVQVVVGKPLNFQVERDDYEVEFSNETPSIKNLWRGWDSLRVKRDFDFEVFERDQIRTCHVVKFDGGANVREGSLEENRCSVCGQNQRALYRLKDETRLCKVCVTKGDKLQMLLETDRHVFIEESSVCCSEHKGTRVEHFCFTCGVPVCFECKLTGSHSTGEKATHKLVHIEQAIKQIQGQIPPLNQLLVQKSNKVQKKLEGVDKMLERIEEKQKEVEKQIMEIAQKAIAKSRKISYRKALVVNSYKFELERQIDECQIFKMETNEIREIYSDVEFVTAFPRFQTAVNQIVDRFDDFQEPPINTEITLSGTLDVLDPGFTPQIYNPSVVERSINSARRFEVTSKPNEISTRHIDLTSAHLRNSSAHRHHFSETRPYTSVRVSNVLSQIAHDREKKLQKKGMQLKVFPFDGSHILKDNKLARNLYFSLPFRQLPNTYLLFSSVRDGRSIAKLHEVVDGVGITIVLIQKANNIFGGFAATKWNSNGQPFGESEASFIFSLTKDSFIEYNPKAKDACSLFANRDSLSFGRQDLVLADNFDRCKSVLENSYSAGFEVGSTEAKTFLAGEPVFSADKVEVWGFYSSTT